MLQKQTTRENIQKALKCSANFKAPGLDRIPYELWRVLNNRYHTAECVKKPSFDILEILRKVYNDIKCHGMVQGTNFAESWIVIVQSLFHLSIDNLILSQHGLSYHGSRHHMVWTRGSGGLSLSIQGCATYAPEGSTMTHDQHSMQYIVL
ncbi:unnamed protein product [Mycena citricolor]|uniref:Uncharacterized protein n=1 Tax=Mycena citricolor TaxID=2018698 RepID=A0AAD2HFS1_9AGAR|nr:unnamed protein product [Mycena citricolor]